jgi:hypothetical protein
LAVSSKSILGLSPEGNNLNHIEGARIIRVANTNHTGNNTATLLQKGRARTKRNVHT